MEAKSSTKEHWNKVYEKAIPEKLGWYQEIPEKSLEIINRIDLSPDARIFIAGVGLSTLVENLLEQRYSNLILSDISEIALEKLKLRIHSKYSEINPTFLQGDLSMNVITTSMEQSVDLWHDRAVIHFLTDPEDQSMYVSNLKKVLKPNGYVLFAEFAEGGAKKCSGLDVQNYSPIMMSRLLGDEFTMLESFSYTYTMPSGDTRPYVYCLFRRT